MITSSNLRGKIEKTTFSTRIFNLSPKFFTQIFSGSTRWMQNLIPHPRSTHVAYFWWTLLHEKWEIHEKHDCNHIFSCACHFSCSKVHRKYATWVLLRQIIKFCIQQVLMFEIWIKPYGDKLKIQVEKAVFLKSFYVFTPKILNQTPWLTS